MVTQRPLSKVLSNDTLIYSQPVAQILQSRLNMIYKSGDLILDKRFEFCVSSTTAVGLLENKQLIEST